MNTVCEVCGDIGYKNLLLCCEDCKSSAAHQYCLNEVVFDAKLVEWLCHECLQRRSEVSCSRSLEKVLSERQPSHTHFGSILHQPITNTVESARDAGPWRNRKRKSCMTEYAHGDSTSKVIDGLTRERENVRFQLKASNGMEQSRMAANVPPPSTLQNGAADKVMPFSPDYGCKKMYSCGGIKNIPHAREENVDSVYVSSSSEHDTTESSESSERLAECQKVSSCHHGGTVRMGAASLSYEESGEDIFSESESLESRDVQAPPRPDYVLSCGRYLSKAQKMRVVKFIQETQPEFTVFVAVMRKGNVQPPGPFLAISKGYAFAHFPHESTHVTLQRPGMSKEWHPKFYKRDEYRKYFLMGQWLDFVNDNNVQEGDICLILPSKGGRRCIFTVYLLRTTSSHSRGGANFQRDGPCPGGSSAKIAPEVHINEEPTDEEHVYVESHMREISHKSLDDEDTGGPQPPYIVSCRNDLSKSQKKIVEERVRAIQSKVPIYVAILKNNNIGMAQKWMLELGSRYASVHLPARGKTVVLQCRRKTWEAKMVIHNGRRWFLNGGWPKFARDNGLRVGDLCLFELKKNKGSNLTMTVHIISREQFEGAGDGSSRQRHHRSHDAITTNLGRPSPNRTAQHPLPPPPPPPPHSSPASSSSSPARPRGERRPPASSSLPIPRRGHPNGGGACHLALALALLAASLSHLLLAAASHLSPGSLHPPHRLLRHPLLRLLPPLLALPFPFLPLAAPALLPLLLLPPLLPLVPLPFLPPHHHPPLRALLLSLPLLLLARAAGLLAGSFPPFDLQQHALAVARLLLLAAAGASLASSLSAPRSAAHFAAEAALACAGAVGGLWAAQAGLSLYVDTCVPAGCHRLVDAGAPAPATRCDVEEARLRAVAVMDLALSVHCVVVAAVAAGVYLGVARWCGVDGGAGVGRRHNGSYEALSTVAPAGTMAEMEHLPVKSIGGKSVAQE